MHASDAASGVLVNPLLLMILAGAISDVGDEHLDFEEKVQLGLCHELYEHVQK